MNPIKSSLSFSLILSNAEGSGWFSAIFFDRCEFLGSIALNFRNVSLITATELFQAELKRIPVLKLKHNQFCFWIVRLKSRIDRFTLIATRPLPDLFLGDRFGRNQCCQD